MDINSKKHNPEQIERDKQELKDKAFDIYKGMVSDIKIFPPDAVVEAYEAAETFLNYKHE